MNQQQESLPNPIAAITDVLSVITTTVTRVINQLGSVHIPQAIAHMVNMSTGALRYVPSDVSNPSTWYTDMTTDIGEPFVEAFLRGGLGVNPDYNGGKFKFPTAGEIAGWKGSPKPFESDTSQGVAELKRLVGFAMIMPFVWEGIQLLLKLPFADRIPDSVGETIGKIPTEMGISWALGMAMSSIFETAAGRQIEELVNVQLHPNRLDMMTLRAMARQHRITQEQFWAGLDLLGYPDPLKSLILEMDTQQLPITDLQTLWIYGQMNREQVKTYLEAIGFSDSDVDKLLTVYIDKAETQASTIFKTELRTAYIEYRISRDQFRGGTAQLLHNPQRAPNLNGDVLVDYDNAPEQIKMVVDLETAALDFELSHGHRMQSTATLKTLYQTKHITLHELERRLMQMGYSSSDANQLITTWTNQGVPGKPGLTSAKVVSYMASGTLTRQEALARLQDLGVNLKDAVFLVDNPVAKVGPYYAPFSEGTVTQALMDGALDVGGAIAALERLGYSADAAREVVTIAQYTQSHMTTPLSLTPPVHFQGEPPAQWRAAEAGYRQAEAFEQAIKTQFMAGAVGDQQAITMLESLGLAQSDAGFIWYSWYIEKNGHPPGAPA